MCFVISGKSRSEDSRGCNSHVVKGWAQPEDPGNEVGMGSGALFE